MCLCRCTVRFISHSSDVHGRFTHLEVTAGVAVEATKRRSESNESLKLKGHEIFLTWRRRVLWIPLTRDVSGFLQDMWYCVLSHRYIVCMYVIYKCFLTLWMLSVCSSSLTKRMRKKKTISNKHLHMKINFTSLPHQFSCFLSQMNQSVRVKIKINESFELITTYLQLVLIFAAWYSIRK